MVEIKIERVGRGTKRGDCRRGMAAVEVILTTGITLIILGFACHWIIRLCRVLFSLIGIMVGSPLV